MATSAAPRGGLGILASPLATKRQAGLASGLGPGPGPGLGNSRAFGSLPGGRSSSGYDVRTTSSPGGGFMPEQSSPSPNDEARLQREADIKDARQRARAVKMDR